jgi:hypothetical protein
MDKHGKFERELEDLRIELENFQQEKERVRAIIGKIGGVPTFNTRFFNWLFIGVIVVSLVVSFLLGEEAKLTMIELATVALSIKILYMMHCQTRVNHFQLWMQSSIEWRINEMTKLLREIQKQQDPNS